MFVLKKTTRKTGKRYQELQKIKNRTISGAAKPLTGNHLINHFNIISFPGENGDLEINYIIAHLR